MVFSGTGAVEPELCEAVWQRRVSSLCSMSVYGGRVSPISSRAIWTQTVPFQWHQARPYWCHRHDAGR